MYRVILVDDEPSIREGLSYFDWEKYGLSLEGTYENGEQAYERIRRGGIDIVFSDICMPVMDGFELVKKVHENFPEVVFVVISAYDEFSYAQKLFGYNVKGYLLKPLSFTEMDALLHRLVAEFGGEEPEPEAESKREKQESKSFLAESAKQFIEKNYQESLTLNQIAESVYVSAAHLSSVFSAHVGCSVMKYLLRYRIEKAKELLSDPQYRINDVARMVGYEDARYFSQIFKEKTGVTPKEYRNRLFN